MATITPPTPSAPSPRRVPVEAPAGIPRDGTGEAFPPSISDTERLESAKLLITPRSHRTFVRIVVSTILAVVLAMFLPWQQYVSGDGTVTAFSPSDRPQVVPTVIAGRIAEWFVQEGQAVKKGDPILRITEVKPEYLDSNTVDRYRDAVNGKASAVTSKEEKVRQLTALIGFLEQNQRLSVDKARTKIAQYTAEVRAAVIDSATYLTQLERQQVQLEQQLVSLRDVENARIRYQGAIAKLQEKRQGLQAAQIELNSVAFDYGEKIAKARSDRAATQAEVGEGRSEVAKMTNDVSNLTLRNRFYVIRAPQDGYVVRATQAGVGQQLKDGESVVTIMPGTPRKAVALMVKAMDVPLLSVGREVRLQFDGWPALQFIGWPSVAVGTFGGKVQVIDRVPGADGKFRVLVVEDTAHDDPWPPQLNLGSGVLGWALLDNVTVGFELWRQINGFPPSLRTPSDEGFGGEVLGGEGKSSTGGDAKGGKK
jgi:multidrug resistance efflux pump